MPGGPAGLAEGRLELDSACIWLVQADGGRVLPIWPSQYGLRQGESAALVVVDGAGRVVAQVGDNVRGSGGEYLDLKSVERLVGAPIPTECQGSAYVLLSDVHRTDNRPVGTP
jgi:hypothetical protein